MLTNPAPVVFITKDKLEVYQLTLTPAKSATKIAEGNWNSANLSEVVAVIIKKLHCQKIRVLLADELSYSFDLKIAKDLENERQAVKKLIDQKIPEDFSDKDWDYKVVTEKLNTKHIKVFAPVKSFWLVFSQAVNAAGLKIEAVEPISFAEERHQNPIIGLGLKKDLKGKDEEVLNMQPVEVNPSDNQADLSIKEAPRNFDYVDKPSAQPFFSTKKILIVALALIIIGAIIVGAVLTSKKAGQKEPSPSLFSSPLTTTIAPSPEVSPISSPSSELDLTSYSLQILNGSGIKGEAAAVKLILETEGFEDISTANADNYQYTDTEISLKNDIPETVYEYIEQSLSSDYNLVLDSDPLTEESDYDVVIIVGEKITAKE